MLGFEFGFEVREGEGGRGGSCVYAYLGQGWFWGVLSSLEHLVRVLDVSSAHVARTID
ncbi:hypothetical protein AG1IA_08556 [Rhizoctonia solani AG-1 IA]|uniref:Uncharacterized protein n=1 Tax=Thanatephorus cucumeris (strain AG1-IA) TaxID=983506 RepID=L8WGW4_THACA|nr:hypothetical protein AG1IA_08556 [Rhizoctonia solani AG-1 IA]